MVFAEAARLDLDNGPLNGDKVCLYRQNNPTTDLSYGTLTDSFTFFSLKAQGSIQNFGDKLVRQGMLSEGDALIVFRYQYTEESDGTAISPILYPKKEDEFSLAGRWFRLESVTPLMSEDNAVIAYECRGKPSSTEEELTFPLTFPYVLT